MSERMTSIRLPGTTGLAEYGRRTATEMIEKLRAYALDQKRQAETVLAAADGDFHVETYVGVFVQRDKETIQQAAASRAAAPGREDEHR